MHIFEKVRSCYVTSAKGDTAVRTWKMEDLVKGVGKVSSTAAQRITSKTSEL